MIFRIFHSHLSKPSKISQKICHKKMTRGRKKKFNGDTNLSSFFLPHLSCYFIISLLRFSVCYAVICLMISLCMCISVLCVYVHVYHQHSKCLFLYATHKLSLFCISSLFTRQLIGWSFILLPIDRFKLLLGRHQVATQKY